MTLLKNKLFYGWVIVIVMFFVNAIIMGTNTSFGVFFKSIEADFDLTRAATSAVFSVRMVIGAAIALLGGWALDRYGPRLIVLLMGVFTALSLILTSQTESAWQLFLTYGLLLAIGGGASYVTVMSTAMRWFKKKRGLAVGIAGAGGGFGQITMAPFAAYLILAYDWKMAYLVMGIIAGLVLIPISRLLKKDPGEIGTVPDGEDTDINFENISETSPGTHDLKTNFTIGQAFRSTNFYLILFVWLSSAFSLFLVQTHVVPHALDMGFSPIQSATIISLSGFAMMAGMMIIGLVSDRIERKKTALISSVVQAGAVLLLLWTTDIWVLYLFALLFGFAQGGVSSSTTALIGDIFGLSNVGKLMGILSVGWAIGAGLGPLVGGFIFDISGSYNGAFLVTAVIMGIRPVLFILLKYKPEKI